MKIIRNNIIPFSGYKAMNLFGVLFVRGNAKIDDITLNHEKIHTAQIKEMLYVFFYVWYAIEWLIRLFMKGMLIEIFHLREKRMQMLIILTI